jgi:hypothetical protein
MSDHFDYGTSNVCLTNKSERKPSNRTSKIICKKELWVPLAKIGGETPDLSSQGESRLH